MWSIIKHSVITAETKADFEQPVRQEFIPEDHERRASQKLCTVRQNGSVATYINSFRNITLTVPDLHEKEKWDRFVTGRKPVLSLEVRKAICLMFESALNVALSVEAVYK